MNNVQRYVIHRYLYDKKIILRYQVERFMKKNITYYKVKDFSYQ